MAEVTYRPSKITGSVHIPPSKSAAHRALLCAALCDEPCVISPIDTSEDMAATLNGVRALGKSVVFSDSAVRISGGKSKRETVVDCGESGSTLRFMIPVFSALGVTATFIGHGRLPERPIGIYAEILPQHGVQVETAGGLPLTVRGQLRSGRYSLPGNISSQFITGLLFALPLLSGDSEISLTASLESKGYVDLTIGVLKDFGIEIHTTNTGWFIPGGQKYKRSSYSVEGDWSQAAFFLSLAAIAGGPIEMSGLSMCSLQGDKACVEYWQRFGITVLEENGVLKAYNENADKPFRGLRGISADASQIPDMVPALAVTAAFAEGKTVIYNAARLRLKESDRLFALECALRALGADIKAAEDGLEIHGKPHLIGGKTESWNDHRIVMALAAAGCDCTVTVTGAESINKSYPGFFRDLTAIGGTADGICVGQ